MSDDAPAAAAEALGQGHEIGIRLLAVAGAEVGVAAIALEEAVLPLHHHAQVLVVQQQHLDRQLLGEAAGQLLHVHQETAVAVDVDDRS